MLRVREGDQAAFGLFYGKFSRRVHYFFYGLCSDSPVCKDLTQETFLRIWKYRERYAATGSILAYLLTFARYVWLEHCRSLRRHGRPAAEGDGPGARASCGEISDSILRALDGLPEEQRMAFVLQAVEGLSAEDAASVMQCPLHTARSRKILAVKKLRIALQEVWGEERTKESKREVR